MIEAYQFFVWNSPTRDQYLWLTSGCLQILIYFIKKYAKFHRLAKFVGSANKESDMIAPYQIIG
jgi:hypothetical protein